MPNVQNSVGTILKIGIVPVAKLTKVGTPDMSKSEIDVTTLDSTGGYKEFIPDFRDAGTLPIEGFAISDVGQTALKTNFDADTLTSFTIELPNGVDITFDGYVSKYKKGEAAVGQGLAFSAEIRISGLVNYGESVSTGNSACTVTDAADGSALTAETIIPAFAIGTYKNVVTYTTETAVKITVTNATVGTTMELYIDDVYSQDLLTTVPSASIAMAAVGTVKKLTVKVWQTDKYPLYYETTVGRIS